MCDQGEDGTTEWYPVGRLLAWIAATVVIIGVGSSLAGEMARLAEIPGIVPNLKQRLAGCVFAERCALVTDLCRSVAPALELKAFSHSAACHYADKEEIAA